MRKAITAAALSGDTLITLDNVAGLLGCPSLDAALTSTRWRDRLLGVNKIVDVPLYATWAATGNNIMLRGDLSRRVLHVRLDSPVEHPEDRVDFRHPDIREFCRRNRLQLLSAALTILRGYCAAGRPDMKLPPWGSFEAWSALVRGAVVWAELPDPADSRIEIRRTSDIDATALPALLAGIEQLDPEGKGLTVAEILDKSMGYPDPVVVAMREALAVLCPGQGKELIATARSVGMKLHWLRGRVVDGRALHRLDDTRMGARWRVIGQSGTNGSIGTISKPLPENNP
jgi:hypothetical protein